MLVAQGMKFGVGEGPIVGKGISSVAHDVEAAPAVKSGAVGTRLGFAPASSRLQSRRRSVMVSARAQTDKHWNKLDLLAKSMRGLNA